MRQGLHIALAALALLAGRGAAQVTRPTERVRDCTTSGCHAPILDYKVLHGPTAVGACDVCHQYSDPAKHLFKFNRTGVDQCAFCHIDKIGNPLPVVHEPFARGECTKCHNPHGASTRKMLRKDSTPQLCAECHTDVLKGAHAHHPAATDCNACHSPHAAPHAKLLVQESRALCLSCHPSVARAIDDVPHPHAPAAGDCLQCHTPHASDEVGGLRQAPRALCTSCHTEVGQEAAAATHPHSATMDGRACLNCHTPHGSEHKFQLFSNPAGACLECHDKPIRVGETRTVREVAEIGDPALHKHGPIAKDDCSSCHFVHGGELPGLLTLPFSGRFYQEFSAEAYALCFKCHNKAIIEPDSTETNFRDGARNLHAVHVLQEKQGRSCRTCHSTHASKFKQQIADSVAFGQWRLPINYKPVQTGGSCAPGCHKPASYDRGPAALPNLSEPAGSDPFLPPNPPPEK